MALLAPRDKNRDNKVSKQRGKKKKDALLLKIQINLEGNMNKI